MANIDLANFLLLHNVTVLRNVVEVVSSYYIIVIDVKIPSN